MDEGPIREHDLQPQYVGGGEPVLQAVRSPRVLGHVAPHRAHRLRRGVRGVEVPVGRDRLRDVRVDHARLDHHPCVGDVHFENVVEAGQADDDAVRHREGPSAQPRAGPPRHERDPLAVADADHALNLLGGGGEEHRPRHHPEVGEAVALVGAELFGSGDEAALAEDRPERVDGARVHGLPSFMPFPHPGQAFTNRRSRPPPRG